MQNGDIGNRRKFLLRAAGTVGACLIHERESRSQTVAVEPLNDPIYGFLLGSLIGDAAGGPVEFLSGEEVGAVLPGLRSWPPSRRLTSADMQQLGSEFKLLSYESLRPKAAPLGPWKAKAPAGTITDDSRFKIMLMRAVQQQLGRRRPLTAESIATQIVDFAPLPEEQLNTDEQDLIDEGLREFRYAARWVTGERDERIALPPARQWGGVATCAGQMLLLPLAGLMSGRPEAAYRLAWQLDFVDSSLAKDFSCALVAGLASVIAPSMIHRSSEQKGEHLLNTIRRTDPFRLKSVPYVGRPLLKWLDLSTEIVDLAEGSPSRLFELLESKGEPLYWWDAHYTFLVPLTILQFCRFETLPALQMCLDFGHDTDSYAQVAGAIGGGIQSAIVFPDRIRLQVRRQLKQDYNEDPVDWVSLLKQSAVYHKVSLKPEESQRDK